MDRYFVLNSLLGGILIGFGCIAFATIESHILGSFIFSLGLLTVIVQEALLYTGKVGYLGSLLKNAPGYGLYKLGQFFGYEWNDKKREITSETFCLICILMLNLFGIGLTCWLFANYCYPAFDASALVTGRMAETWYQALLKSIGCGAMMFIAVDGYRKTKHPLAVIMPVMAFILCGFDHCIANYGYMAMNNVFFMWQLPVWIIGNAIGSLIVSKLAEK